MRKLKFLIGFLIILIQSVGISQSTSFKISKKYSVTGKEIMKEYFGVRTLNFADTLIIAKLIENDFYFSVYNPTKLQEVIRIAKIGNGPNEFANGLSYYGQFFNENEAIKIWVKGTNSNKLSLINVSKSIDKNKTIVEKEIVLSPESAYSTVFFIDSTKVVGRSYNSTPHMNRLQIYNPAEHEIIKTIPLLPKVKNNRMDLGFIFYRYNYLYVSSLAMKPDKTKFASALSMFNRLDIFDANGNLENSYIDEENITKRQISDYLSAKEQNLDKLSVKNYYMDAYTSNKFIYTLYYNQLQSDYPKQSIPVVIRIFNWKAEPICTINVPDYITTFTIDENSGIMYGVAYFDEKILIYDIKEILDEI